MSRRIEHLPGVAGRLDEAWLAHGAGLDEIDRTAEEVDEPVAEGEIALKPGAEVVVRGLLDDEVDVGAERSGSKAPVAAEPNTSRRATPNSRQRAMSSSRCCSMMRCMADAWLVRGRAPRPPLRRVVSGRAVRSHAEGGEVGADGRL